MSANKTALVIGASRGLGLGLVQRLTEQGWTVTATVRDQSKADELKAVPGIHIQTLDMDEQSSLEVLTHNLKGQVFDLLFVNAGVMGPLHANPTDASAGELGQLFLTNAVAPIRLAKRFVDQVRPETGVIAFMSSVLGSITMPDAPEMALYKASKAALNSMTNTFVTQLGDHKPTVLSLHPGWVRTAMGGEGADIDVETSVRGLVEQVDRFTGKGGHHFVNYKGETIPW
jgi:NAD(P)-dependent dehydrogenase (short-subunit alcohol dehydrogenase family)